MGTEVCRAVEADPGLELVAAIDPGHVGRDAPALAAARPDLVVSSELRAIVDAGAEVAVDFTNASAARDNLELCARAGIHAVCGTTGIAPVDTAYLARLFAADDAPNCVLAANFAISAVLLLRFAELAAPYLDGVEIVELHHDHKRDAPSGTALETARRIAAARGARGAGPFSADPTTEEVLPGARGGVGPGGIRIHSVRLPGLVAHEEVLFGAAGQSLTIRQDSYDRRSFMAGVLLAVRRVSTTPGFTVGLEALLEL